MLGRREWRLRTRFREIVIRCERFGREGRGGSAAPLLMDLLFEVENHNPEAARIVGEVHAALRAGLGARTPLNQVRWDFETAVRSGQLVIEELKAPPHVPVLVAPEEEPEPPSEEPETTFIVIETRDEDD